MLTKAGAKLLDFGLAKLREQAPLAGLTEVATQQPLTGAGRSSARCSIWPRSSWRAKTQMRERTSSPLGQVLYEMLTGRRPFKGDSHATLIGNILHVDPPALSSVTAVAPPALDRVLQICLAKDPDRRWSSAHDLSLQLQSVSESGHGPHTSAKEGAPRRHRVVLTILAAIAGAALAVTAMAVARKATSSQRRVPIRFVLTEPPGVTWRVGVAPVVSPDGQYVAAFGTGADGIVRLYIRALQALSAYPVAGTSAELVELAFWSPDSRHVGFADGRKLKRVAVAGGPSQVVCDLPDDQWALATWNHQDIILFGSFKGPLMRVNAAGGVPEAVTKLDSTRRETGHVFPRFLPDGNGYLYLTVANGKSAMYAARLDSTERVLLKESTQSEVMYVETGYLMFERATQLTVQRFDPRTFKLSGPEVPVELSSRALEFSVSPTGTLTYMLQEQPYQSRGELLSTNGYLAVIDRAGREVTVLSPVAGYQGPRVSPDGKTVIVERFDDENPGDLWAFEVRRRVGTRVSFDPDTDCFPVWLPNGKFILFSRMKQDARGALQGSGALLAIDINRSDPERVVHRAAPNQYGPWVMDASQDGRYALVLTNDQDSSGDLDAIPLSGGPKIPVARSRFEEHQARFSADGRWVAYASDESGQSEIYAQSFPQTAKKTLVSTAGGYQPSWRHDGRELFYLSPDRTLMSVDVQGVTELEFGIPKPLFKAPVAEPDNGRNHYDPFGDGQRFLLNVVKPQPPSVPRLVVVLDWASTLPR